MKNYNKEKLNIKKGGYAIMFTVILISIISLIGIGLSNTIYKQLVLSSVAKDSQLAFYMSDMAAECALYVDVKTTNLDNSPNFSCGVDPNGSPYTLDITKTVNGTVTTYDLIPPSILSNSTDQCFRINIIKDTTTGTLKTTTSASGYNICDKTNARTVERTIEVTY